MLYIDYSNSNSDRFAPGFHFAVTTITNSDKIAKLLAHIRHAVVPLNGAWCINVHDPASLWSVIDLLGEMSCQTIYYREIVDTDYRFTLSVTVPDFDLTVIRGASTPVYAIVRDFDVSSRYAYSAELMRQEEVEQRFGHIGASFINRWWAALMPDLTEDQRMMFSLSLDQGEYLGELRAVNPNSPFHVPRKYQSSVHVRHSEPLRIIVK